MVFKAGGCPKVVAFDLHKFQGEKLLTPDGTAQVCAKEKLPKSPLELKTNQTSRNLSWFLRHLVVCPCRGLELKGAGSDWNFFFLIIISNFF